MVNEVNWTAEHCMLLLHLLLQNCLLLLLLKLQELHRLTAVADAACPIVAMAVAIIFFSADEEGKEREALVDLAALANVMLVILTNLRLLPIIYADWDQKYGELTEMKTRRKVPWTTQNLLFF